MSTTPEVEALVRAIDATVFTAEQREVVDCLISLVRVQAVTLNNAVTTTDSLQDTIIKLLHTVDNQAAMIAQLVPTSECVH